jgi:hypothetical protein
VTLYSTAWAHGTVLASDSRRRTPQFMFASPAKHLLHLPVQSLLSGPWPVGGIFRRSLLQVAEDTPDHIFYSVKMIHTVLCFIRSVAKHLSNKTQKRKNGNFHFNRTAR